ncbi:MAG: GC-type dockerin domain-anchored protein [Planctomycetota bacterium]
MTRANLFQNRIRAIAVVAAAMLCGVTASLAAPFQIAFQPLATVPVGRVTEVDLLVTNQSSEADSFDAATDLVWQFDGIGSHALGTPAEMTPTTIGPGETVSVLLAISATRTGEIGVALRNDPSVETSITAAAEPYTDAFWVDFDAADNGVGTAASPLNTLKPFMFPLATEAVDGFDGVQLNDNTIIRLRGQGDAINAAGVRFVRVDGLTLTAWEDGGVWEIRGGVDLRRFPFKTAADRGDRFSNVITYDLSEYVSDLVDVRGFEAVDLAMVVRDYRPELPETVGTPPVWSPKTNYEPGDIVRASSDDGRIYRARYRGRSGAFEPVWESARLVEIIDDGANQAWDVHDPEVHTVSARGVFVPSIEGKVDERSESGVGASYDPISRELHVVTPSGDAPGTGSEPVWEVGLRGSGGEFDFDSTVSRAPMLATVFCDDFMISGGRLTLWLGSQRSGNNRTLEIAVATGMRVLDMYIAYAANDAIAIIGGQQTNNWIDNLTLIGLGDDSGVVYFVQGEDEFIDGCGVRDSQVHCVRPTSYFGGLAELSFSAGASAFASHLGGNGELRDVLFERCVVTGYGAARERTTFAAFSPRDGGTPTGPFGDPASHAVRIVDCRAYFSGLMPIGGGAVVRSYIGMVRGGAHVLSVTRSGYLFESSAIVARDPMQSGVFRLEQGGRVEFRNSLVAAPLLRDAGFFAAATEPVTTVAFDRSVIINTGEEAQPLMSSVFVSRPFETPFLVVEGPDTTSGPSVWLEGFSDTTVHVNGADQPPLPIEQHPLGGDIRTGMTGLLSNLAFGREDGARPDPASPLGSQLAGPPNGLVGLLGNPSSGRFGPYQFGSDPALNTCLADIAAPIGVVNLSDLFAYIGMYTAQNAGADVASPVGVLNLTDLFAFIDAYTAGCD